jgi:hypothetical protein
MTVAEHREAILALIYDRWHAAKEEQNQYENDMPEWAEAARGNAELLQELANAVRKLTEDQ